MNMMKHGLAHRVFALLLALVMVIGMLPITAGRVEAVASEEGEPAIVAEGDGTEGGTPEDGEGEGDEEPVPEPVLPKIEDVTITFAQNLVYVGKPLDLVAVEGTQEGDTVNYTNAVANGAGTYEVVVTVAREGYETLTVKKTVTVGVKPVHLGNVAIIAGEGRVDNNGTASVTITNNNHTFDKSEGWKMGLKVTANDKLKTEADFENVTYAGKNFWANKETAEDGTHSVTLWAEITKEKLLDNAVLTYSWNFDWNGDGKNDQKVTLQIDRDKVTLKDENGIYTDFVRPTISNVVVEKENDWTNTAKKVTFAVSDNVEVASVKYGTDSTGADAVDAAIDRKKYTFTAEENGTYYIFATDKAGNEAKETVVVDYIDTVKPTLVSITGEPENAYGYSYWWYYTIVVDDAYGEIDRVWKKGGDQNLELVEGTTNTWKFRRKHDSEITIYVSDKAGNTNAFAYTKKDVQNIVNNPYTSDISAPTVSYQYETGWTTGNVVIKVTATDDKTDDSGMQGVYYTIDEKALDADREGDDPTKKSPASLNAETGVYEISATRNGTYHIYSVDKAGNWSVVVIDIGNIDAAIPVVNPVADNFAAWVSGTVEITVNASDDVSGIQSVYYSVDSGFDFEAYKAGTATYTVTAVAGDTFTATADKVNAPVYYIWAVDNVGQYSQLKTLDTVNIDTVAPAVVAPTFDKTKNENDWFKEVPVITIPNAIQENNTAPVTNYFKFGAKDAEANEVTFNGMNNPVVPEDGEYVLVTWAKDEADNKGNDTVTTVNVDTKAPINLTITADVESMEGEEPQTGILLTNNSEENAQIKFYKSNLTFTLTAEDETSGIDHLYYAYVNAYNEIPGTWTEYTGAFTKAPNSQFVLAFKAVDKAGNETIAYSYEIILDNQTPSGSADSASPEIVVTLPAANENGIYNKSVPVDITIFDPVVENVFSGLESVVVTIHSADLGKTQTIDLVKEGAIAEHGNVTVTEKADTNGRISKWVGTVTISAEEFNSNDVTFSIQAIDNSGMARSKTTENIDIDITKPDVAVSYDNNDADSGKYYKANRTATIKITERNFDPADVNITLKNTDGVIPKLSGWTTTMGTGNKDNTVHTATLTYSADGDYTFDISFVDMAGWDNTPVSYSGNNPQEFTIDKTLPVINVAYDNNAVANGKYFNATRTATVTITEHNFDPTRVNVTINTARGGVAPSVSWRNSGDTHVATLAYTTDGDYTFDISMRDMAGNANNGVGYGNSAAATDFVVDTTFEEMISYEGVENGKAYGDKETVIPSIEIADINLDNWVITLVGKQLGKTTDLSDKVKALMKDQNTLVTGKLDLFKAVQELDGIYTLTMTGTDLAGNIDTEEVIFTVNRFGSVYDFDKTLTDLVANGGAYVQTVPEDLVITEYNADKLVPGSVVIEITRDGKPLDTVIFEVTPDVNDQVKPGETGWYQYTYRISKDNFLADGIYKIYISSKDATGNTPENGNYEDKVMTFRVDATAPEITSVVGLEEAVINAQEVTVKYTIYDTIGLKSIKIFVDGQLVGTEIVDFGSDPNNYEGTFTLYEKTASQHVQILVEDLAANVTDTDDENFESAYVFNKNVTVSTNFFVRWYAQTGLFWGSIAGFLALIVALLFFILGKKKKEEEAAA